MHLLHAKTLRLEEYYGESIPPYTILSHRWGKDEVSFRDITQDLTRSREKLGFMKIQFCIDQTLDDGYEYCWIDTCCIDKSDSAQLTEAINSMYAWYQNAEVCYAYLEDVEHLFTQYFPDIAPFWDEHFFRSIWWTRGWTLQELIGPKLLRFYSRDWKELGTKDDLQTLIQAFTGIDKDILTTGDVSTASVAQKMSWAARRETTRVEDMAYCLMGILDVNMPVLYGEGKKAFIRLQEEIIKTEEDHSIFAWTSKTATPATFRGLFARSPSEFEDCQDIQSFPGGPGEPLWMTNRGLRITLPVASCSDDSREFHVFLKCGFSNPKRLIAVRVCKMGNASGDDSYARVNCSALIVLQEGVMIPTKTLTMTVRVRQKPLPIDGYYSYRCLRFAGIKFSGLHASMHRVWPSSCVTSHSPLTVRIPYDDDIIKDPQQQLQTIRIMLNESKKSLYRGLILLEWNAGGGIQRSIYGTHIVLPQCWRGRLLRVQLDYHDIEAGPPRREDVVLDTDSGELCSWDLPTSTKLIEDELVVVVNDDRIDKAFEMIDGE